VRDGRAAALKLPKVELHVHLEATQRPTTLKDLAREQNEDLPARFDSDSDVPL
jgi:adenosine deaminase